MHATKLDHEIILAENNSVVYPASLRDLELIMKMALAKESAYCIFQEFEKFRFLNLVRVSKQVC